MNWDIVLQYLPDGLCVLLCLFGCLCNWVRTGSMKKLLQSFCPSSEPLEELEHRVDDLSFYLGAPLHEELSAFAEISTLYDRVGALVVKLDDISHAIQSAMRGDVYDD